MGDKVKFQHVTKRYKLYHKAIDKLKDLFTVKERGEYHYALRNISFSVQEGEIVGIVGTNGSGKSTLSNLIAGVTIPNEGRVEVNGSAALIAISSGLNPQLTGMQNIELKGLMMGLSREQIADITPKVIEFAEIGKFMYQPVKTYSSGMKSRLGFAISVHIDPDILVVDEALSVGDQTFTDRCISKMNEFKEQGKTIFFISHSLPQVQSFCTKAIWLMHGTIEQYGPVEEVMRDYSSFLQRYKQMTKEEREQLRENAIRRAGEQQSEREEELSRKRQEAPRRRKSRLIAAVLITLILAIGGAFAIYEYGRYSALQNQGITEQEEEIPAEILQGTVPIPLAAVRTNDVIVREKASADSKKLTIVSFGDIFEVLGEQQNYVTDTAWKRVRLNQGVIGWISSDLLHVLGQTPAPADDNALQTLDILFEQQYGVNTDLVKSYFGMTNEQIQAAAERDFGAVKTIVSGRLLEANDVRFILNENKVQSVSFLNTALTPKTLAQVAGTPIFTSDDQTGFFYETKSYYIIAQTENKETISILLIQQKQS